MAALKKGTMPSKAKRFCKMPGCNELVESGYCDKHKQNNTERDTRESASRRGYDGFWRKIRVRHLSEHPFCFMCQKQGKIKTANEVHHIKPLSDGGTNSDNNLMSLCKTCHSRITSQRGVWGG